MNPTNEGLLTRWGQIFFLVVIAVPIGLVVQYIDDSRREARFAAFESGDFDLIVLREDNAETAEQIVDAVKSLGTLSSHQSFGEGDETKELLRVGSSHETLPNDLPLPQYLEKSARENWLTHEPEDQYDVIYAIFTGPDALQNTRMWLKRYGYESQFPLKKAPGTSKDATDAVTLIRKTEGRTSQISLVAYFWSGPYWNPRFNIWNGTDVRALHDMADRPAVKKHTAYAAWLKEAAE